MALPIIQHLVVLSIRITRLCIHYVNIKKEGHAAIPVTTRPLSNLYKNAGNKLSLFYLVLKTLYLVVLFFRHTNVFHNAVEVLQQPLFFLLGKTILNPRFHLINILLCPV